MAKANNAALSIIRDYHEQQRTVGGQPRLFDSPEDLEGLFMTYISYCEETHKMANIAGFCTYMRNICGRKINRDTYYSYKGYDGYSDTIKAIDMAIEDMVLNSHQYNALIRMAYLNNKCGYARVPEIVPDTEETRSPEQLLSDLQDKVSRYNKLISGNK